MKTYKGKAWFGVDGGFCRIPVEVELYREEWIDEWENGSGKWETEDKIMDVLFSIVDKDEIHFDWEKGVDDV
jgi:hypothetical protein